MIYIADENDEGKRLDLILTEVLENVSRSKIQTQIKNGNITVNSKSQKPSYILKEDDEIEITEIPPSVIEIKPQNILLDIVYEDENMLVVNKPSGMLTHPTVNETENTLVNALLYKYGKNFWEVLYE